MEAFGTAAAALQFSVALLKSAQALHAILTGKSSEPVVTMKKLGQIAKGECDGFLTRFPVDSTPDIKDARVIAQQGKDICDALLKKIAKMHPDKKNPKTLAWALVTIMWSKDELAELQQSLSNCLQALERFFAQQDRAMVGAALKDAQKDLASQIDAKSNEILELHSKASAQADSHWGQVIQLANAASEKRSAQKKANLLLDALAFPGMGQRYNEVSAADKSTFRWILEGHENSSVDDRFSRWLTSGNDVFHIMGKPGSGKSTLMKYVFENAATTEMLEQWADGKALVKAACFFWKPGAVLQKTEMGLTRTLLHGIILARHDVAKTLFPEVWNTEGIEEKAKISLPDAAIQKAFQRLVDGEARSAGANLCCCFFIDGLDEYGDASNGIIRLVRKITHLAQNGRGWLKICASSREDQAITDNLAVDEAHRVTLQDLTRGDITALVERRLQETFPGDDIFKDEDLADLRDAIIKQAEGVFLWVVLVLGIIDEEAGPRKPVRELQDFVQAQHDDLDTFFKTIVDRIEKRNRKKAAILFQYTLRVGMLKHGELHRVILADKLVWYTFLLEHPTVEGSGDQDAVLARYEQVYEQMGQHVSRNDVHTLDLSETARRVKRYGAGLLAVTANTVILDADLVVALTHRSIHEFLTTLLATQWKDAVSGFDVAGAHARMLHTFCMSTFREGQEAWNVLMVDMMNYFHLQNAAGPDCPSTERMHRNFQLIEACAARIKAAWQPLSPIDLPPIVEVASECFCHEYLEWRRHKSHAQQELKGKNWWLALRFMITMTEAARARNGRLLRTIEQLLASGASVSVIFRREKRDKWEFSSPWLVVVPILSTYISPRRDRTPEPFQNMEAISEIVSLFIQASDRADGVLPMWVWLDEETLLVVMDGHVLGEEEHGLRRLVWRCYNAHATPAGKAIPGTVSLAEMLAELDGPGNAAALAAAREPEAARARRAEQLLSAESLAQLRLALERLESEAIRNGVRRRTGTVLLPMNFESGPKAGQFTTMTKRILKLFSSR